MAKQTFTTGQVLTAAQMTSLQQTAMGGGSTTAKTASYTLVAADAGTVVQMNSASATTITVNTALFAAGDSVQIQNVGAGVCTVTAGTATVSTAGSLALSQYEGGQLYFNTTSAALFFDTVQSSGGGDENWSLVSTTATTSGTSITITGLGTYKQLIFYFDRISTATGGTVLTCRFNSSSTANYTDFGLRADGTAVVAENRNNSGTEFTLFGSDTAAGRMTGYLSVTGAQSTGFKVGQFVGAGGATASNVTQVKGFVWANAATISSILVTTGDGYTFDAGSIYIYGSTN